MNRSNTTKVMVVICCATSNLLPICKTFYFLVDCSKENPCPQNTFILLLLLFNGWARMTICKIQQTVICRVVRRCIDLFLFACLARSRC